MATKTRFLNAYGFSPNPIQSVFQPPIITNRNPTTADQAQLGTVWVNKSNNDFYVLTSIVNALSTWTGLGGGAPQIAPSYTATTGNITAQQGNIIATLGNITATAGNIAATAGSITAGSDIIATGVIAGASVEATGDTGAGGGGTVTLTSVTDTAQSTGALSIKSDSANNGSNAGFIKVYVGAATAYIPYFTNIAP